jgi:hypothetical protein
MSGGEWREPCFDLIAEWLVSGWQLECFAEMRRVFVAVEARLVRGNLEQNATRRAEVDRPEIVAVDDWA